MKLDRRIRLLEELANRSWPAEEIVCIDGWHLRFGQGVTRRTNSVWPISDDGENSLDDKIDQIERELLGQ